MSNDKVFIGLGGNLGNPANIFSAALKELESRNCRVLQRSSLYQTKPYGFSDQPDFLNAVAELETDMSPKDILFEMKEIEDILGKKVLFKNGPRAIDLDLLFHGETVITCPELILPHPGISERDFVLLPMMEIQPEFRHPVLGLTIKELVAGARDLHFTGEMKKW